VLRFINTYYIHCIFSLLFHSCPPRTFLPALCRIFLDELVPDSVLEVTARAITYYLDVSAECTRRVVAMEGAVKAICSRLSGAGLGSRASRDLAEQCIKVRFDFMDNEELRMQQNKILFYIFILFFNFRYWSSYVQGKQVLYLRPVAFLVHYASSGNMEHVCIAIHCTRQ